MAARRLKFSLSSYWRIGSGAGAGAVADATVVRDASGLPIIPGRTVKGLIRDAMAGAVPAERIERWFGTSLPAADDSDKQEQQLEEGRFRTRPGVLWFGSAQLSDAWRQWAKSSPASEIRESLFCYVSSTAINQDGTAREHSLRVVEVAVPMDLYADLRGPDDDDAWIADVRASLPLLRALGSRRSRGYGRVDVSLEEAR